MGKGLGLGVGIGIGRGLDLRGDLARMEETSVLVGRPLGQPRAPDQRVVCHATAATQLVQLYRRDRAELVRVRVRVRVRASKGQG